MGARTINLDNLLCHAGYGESSELLAGRLSEVGGIAGLQEYPMNRGRKVGWSA
jgi:hypothetical protein